VLSYSLRPPLFTIVTRSIGGIIAQALTEISL